MPETCHRLHYHYYAFILTALHDLSNYQVIQIDFLKLSLLEKNESIILFHSLLTSTMFLLVYKAMNEESSVDAMKCKFTLYVANFIQTIFAKLKQKLTKEQFDFIKMSRK